MAVQGCRRCGGTKFSTRHCKGWAGRACFEADCHVGVVCEGCELQWTLGCPGTTPLCLPAEADDDGVVA